MTVHALDGYRWSKTESRSSGAGDHAGGETAGHDSGTADGEAAGRRDGPSGQTRQDAGDDGDDQDGGVAEAIAAGIVGTDPGLLRVIRAAARMAATTFPVLVTGESGTGKELIARLIHDRGSTPQGPFVAVNCGTLSRELADSELFGHERGAFTGAHGRKRGWFEEADGGTLVLDEIGELSLELQPKLLRVLETGRVRRVGGSGDVAVKVRVVALTLRELPREVARGAFRLDLYHRLAGLELSLPPLRARRGDVAPLTRHFLEQMGRELGPRSADAGVLARLAAHDWPGNVRELRNVLRRAALVCPRHLDVAALNLSRAASAGPVSLLDGGAGWRPRVPALAEPGPPEDPTPGGVAAGGAPADAPGTSGAGGAVTMVAATAGALWPDGVIDVRGLTFEQIERQVYGWALRQHGGSRRKAARALGIARSTFCDKVKRHALG